MLGEEMQNDEFSGSDEFADFYCICMNDKCFESYSLSAKVCRTSMNFVSFSIRFSSILTILSSRMSCLEDISSYFASNFAIWLEKSILQALMTSINWSFRFGLVRLFILLRVTVIYKNEFVR